MNNEFLPAYKVYQQVIDLELYYAFVDLVVHTSQEEKAWEIYRNIVDTQIWQQKAEGQNYFEAYNLRYPGEVLERFEEKLGKDVRIIRALALALGKTRALQLDNMFVGNQRGSFLQMIRRTSNGDVYLQGALYLLETDMPRRHALLDELAATEYQLSFRRGEQLHYSSAESILPVCGLAPTHRNHSKSYRAAARYRLQRRFQYHQQSAVSGSHYS